MEIAFPQYVTGKSFVFGFLSNWGNIVKKMTYGSFIFVGRKGEPPTDKKLPLPNVAHHLNVLNKAQQHPREVLSIAWSYDGNYIATGSKDKTIKMWKRDGNSWRAVATLSRGHSHWVTTVAFVPGDMELLSGSVDQVICIWKKEDGEVGRNEFDCEWKKRYNLEEHAQEVSVIRVRFDGKQAVSGG